MKTTIKIIGNLAVGCALACCLTSKTQAQLPPGITNSGDGGTNTYDYYPGFNPTPTFTYPTNATLLWQFSLGYNVFGPASVAPDGTICVSTLDGNHLSAINPDGSQKWETNVATISCGPGAIGVDGTIYTHGVYGSDHFIDAINPTNGTVKWNCTGTGTNDFTQWGALALGTDGTVYIADELYSEVFAITNGAIKWVFSGPASAAFKYSSPVIGKDGTIYISSRETSTSAALYAINPDGSPKWSTNLLNAQTNIINFDGGLSGSCAIAADGTIYFGAANYLFAVNTNGMINWQFFVTNQIFQVAPEIGLDGTIYIEAFDNYYGIDTHYTNTLYAVNQNGTIKWTFPLPMVFSDYIPWYKRSSCAIASDGEIYVSGSDGTLYSLAPDGTMNWSYQTDLGGLDAPVIGVDGTVYVTTYDGSALDAFYGPSSIACSEWPESGRNSRHTAAVAIAQVNSPLMLTNGFQFTMNGPTNMPVCPCASSDLATWTNMSQTILTGGSANFVDTGVSNYPYRFYEAKPQ